ncbi:MAG: FHA domain-containing protein [Butyrivibrio sp.]|uniref:FHA domain-containing protein n=1 Tax=Butyrivibrio sp. TaxID=28121 RepID=UPI001B0936A2|nr:FHA domain-containing protein [Butyrivibrio sp.]MBO6239518.1 FHA domain-containing protein [Butyrivibrio sp.]
MALAECSNGHLYDTDQYATCPYCQGGINRVEFSEPTSGVGRTVGIGTPGGVPITPEIGATVAPAGYGTPKAANEDTGKTVAVMQKSMNTDPVVGWIICIEGTDKGKDYRVFGKNNTIGRSEKMDICIKGDSTISRENHAKLAYDIKHNVFHLIPADNVNGIYVNDEPVYVPTQLHAYDLIELGESKFVFIPFCSEQFTWQDGLRKG